MSCSCRFLAYNAYSNCAVFVLCTALCMFFFFFGWLWKYARRAFVAVYFRFEWIVARIRMLIRDAFFFVIGIGFVGSKCVPLFRDVCACMRTMCSVHCMGTYTIGKCVWLCSLERNKNKTIDARLFCLLQYSIAGTEVVELHCDTTYVFMHWESVSMTIGRIF